MKSPVARYCLLTASVLMTLQLRADPQETEQPAQEQAQPQPLQKLFVSDRLVLNVYSEPDQAGERVATIETGDVVDELARSGSFVQVRVAGGQEGWVGASYLTTDVPAAARLRELERKQKAAALAADKQSGEEIGRLRAEAAALQAQVEELKVAALRPATPPETAPQATRDSEPGAAADAPIGKTSVWVWPLTVALSIGLGFMAGYQTLAGRIRKRFGRLKIY